MDAGFFDRFVEVQRKRRTSDGKGGHAETYDQVGQIWARLSRESSSERERAGREDAKVFYSVFAQDDADLQRGDRVVDEALTVELVSVGKPSTRDHLECSGFQVEVGL